MEIKNQYDFFKNIKLTKEGYLIIVDQNSPSLINDNINNQYDFYRSVALNADGYLITISDENIIKPNRETIELGLQPGKKYSGIYYRFNQILRKEGNELNMDKLNTVSGLKAGIIYQITLTLRFKDISNEFHNFKIYEVNTGNFIEGRDIINDERFTQGNSNKIILFYRPKEDAIIGVKNTYSIGNELLRGDSTLTIEKIN